MKWKRTEIKMWRLIRPAKPFFKKYYDGEVAMHYFGTLVITVEHWYEAAEHRVHWTLRLRAWLMSIINRASRQ